MTTLADIDREIDAAKNNPSPPPATPTPTPLPSGGVVNSQAAQFFNDMMMYENWKQTVYSSEQRKRDEIESRLRIQLQEQLERQIPGIESDPVMQEAGKLLIEAFKAGMFKRTPGTPQLQNVQPQPSNEVETMKPEQQPFTQAHADMIADRIEDNYPELCAKARAGQISKDDAIAKIVQGGADPAHAEMIYLSIMDVTYDDPGL